MDVDVAVVGGGFAGLFTAVSLAERGIDDVVVLERADRPGGVARTIHEEGYILEPAAGTLLLPHPHLSPILAAAGVGVVPAEGAAIRYVYTRGRLVQVQPSPHVLLAPLVGWGAKLRGALEPLVRSRATADDESLAALLERRFGRGLGNFAASLMAAGVFAGDPRRLSARSAFPALGALAASGGSILRAGLRAARRRDRSVARPSAHLAVPGMADLADALAATLGERLRTGFEVAAVAAADRGCVLEGREPVRARRVVLACRPSVAAAMLGGDAAERLRRSVAAPVAVVWLGGPESGLELPDGFGALIAPDAGLTTIGALFESSYAPSRAPSGHGLVKAIVGGARMPEVPVWDDDRIGDTVVDELSQVLGREPAPAFTKVVRHREGIPQYEVGHEAWLTSVETALPAGVHLTGWGYRGVGIAHLASDAAVIAGRIAAA